MLGNRETIREHAKRSEEIFKISLDKIVIRESFNKRNADNYGDIESLAASLLENGQVVPGRVDVLENGTFILVDGHRRFAAFQLLQKQGHEPLFKAIINDRKTTELERILQMFVTQDNKPLESFEVAELIKQIKNMGYNQTEIANMLGKSQSYVSLMMDFSTEDNVVKDAVTQGKLTVSEAVKLKKQIPSQSQRSEKVKQAVANSGSKKVSVSEITGIDKKQKKAEEVANIILKGELTPERIAKVLRDNY